MKTNEIGNVLMVSNHSSDTAYAWWLMEHFWVNLAQHFATKGQQAFVAYPKIAGLSKKISESDITAVELCVPWSTRDEFESVRDFLRANDIQTIYFTDQKYLNFQYRTLRQLGVKNILVHDHTPGDRPPVGGVKGFLKSVVHRIPSITATAVYCVSDHMRNRNLANGRVPPEKLIVVQNGIVPLNLESMDSTETRRALGIGQSTFVVVSTGRANPYKRLDFIIDCAAALKTKATSADFVFLIAGDGPAMPELKRQVERLELQDHVKLLGFRTDVHELLNCADVAFHAALGEGFSLSIVEYMSAGLPVLVPDIPSVTQSLVHDETGLFFRDGDIESASEHLMQLMANVDRRKAMGALAKQTADTLYSLDACTRAFEQANQEVLPFTT
ncbi:MAG: glycosyltransferase family 4 protein [Pseudomonadota bacterium]